MSSSYVCLPDPWPCCRVECLTKLAVKMLLLSGLVANLGVTCRPVDVDHRQLNINTACMQVFKKQCVSALACTFGTYYHVSFDPASCILSIMVMSRSQPHQNVVTFTTRSFKIGLNQSDWKITDERMTRVLRLNPQVTHYSIYIVK